MLHIFDHMRSDNIEWFIEDNAISPSYDSAPPPPPPSVSNLCRRHTGTLGDRGWGKKAWSSINHSILSACSTLLPGQSFSLGFSEHGLGKGAELAKIGFLQHSQLID
jgi:hypothetical protein